MGHPKHETSPSGLRTLIGAFALIVALGAQTQPAAAQNPTPGDSVKTTVTTIRTIPASVTKGWTDRVNGIIKDLEHGKLPNWGHRHTEPQPLEYGVVAGLEEPSVLVLPLPKGVTAKVGEFYEVLRSDPAHDVNDAHGKPIKKGFILLGYAKVKFWGKRPGEESDHIDFEMVRREKNAPAPAAKDALSKLEGGLPPEEPTPAPTQAASGKGQP